MSNATTLIHPSRDHLMRRHFPLSAQINAALSRITNGADAEKLLATKAPDAGGTILQAPSFVQVEFRGSLSPNRILYPSGSTVVFAADDEQVTVDFEIPNTLLPTMSDRVVLDPAGVGGHDLVGHIPGTAPEQYGTPVPVTEVMSGAAARIHLRKIIEDGKHARFELANMLRPYTEHAVDAAARSVYSEIVDLSENDARFCIPAVGASDQERIVSELLYATDGKTDSVILRMIDRAACTDWAVGKHVSRRMAQAIWGAAETHVRRSIGDPHVGRQVRALAREHGISDPNELLAVFREKYPTKIMGAPRIRASLEVRDLFARSSTVSAIDTGLSLAPAPVVTAPAARPTESVYDEDVQVPVLAEMAA